MPTNFNYLIFKQDEDISKPKIPLSPLYERRRSPINEEFPPFVKRGDFLVKSFVEPQLKIKDLKSCVHRVAFGKGARRFFLKIRLKNCAPFNFWTTLL